MSQADAIAFEAWTDDAVKSRDPLATRSLHVARRIYQAVRLRPDGSDIDAIIAGAIIEAIRAELESQRRDLSAANALARKTHLQNHPRFLEAELERTQQELVRCQ